MDLCLLCLLIIVPIHMISCFMIPLALFLRRRAAAAVIFNLERQLFYPVVVGWREYAREKGKLS